MIKVKCVSNIDDFQREIWPKKLCCRPMIGDKIQSSSGKEGRITEITHSEEKMDYFEDDDVMRSSPILKLYISRLM